jgi:hypothetical protein
MKHNYKLTLIAVAGLVLTCFGCRKLKDDGTTANTADPTVVSTEIASNLSEALYGTQGGFSISDGLDYPSNIVFKSKGKARIESAGNFGCGFKIDTTFSLKLGDSDTSKLDLWEKIKYEVLCTNSKPSSITVNDSLNLVLVGGGANITEKYGKNFVLKSLNPGVSNLKLQLDGALNAYVNGTYTEAGKAKAISASFNFKLTGLMIDRAADADITDGHASFTTKGTYEGKTWNYSGTITFQGNHKAQFTINGKVYTINIKTGQVL